MNVVIPISLLSFLFALLASKKRVNKGLEFCFILLTIVGAVHYNYGNDYLNYLMLFQEAGYLTVSRQTLYEFFRDPGWILLCIVFKPFGFFSLVIFLNIIQNFIYYRIIKTQVERDWWWLAVFIYLFNTSLYLLNFSMMRQGLAIALIIASFFLLINKRFFLAVCLVLVSSFIHSTSIIAIPFLVVLPFLKNIKFLLPIYVALFVILLFAGDFVYSFFMQLSITDSLDEYSAMYQQNSRIKLGIGFLIDIISLLVIVFVIINNKQIQPKYIQLAGYFCVGYLLLPLQSVNMMVGRLGYYFSVSSLVAIPFFYSFIKNNIVRLALLSLFILITVYRYYMFFTTGAFADSYSQPFTTIFNVPWR